MNTFKQAVASQIIFVADAVLFIKQKRESSLFKIWKEFSLEQKTIRLTLDRFVQRV